MTALKRTPLYAAHQRMGGKLIEFGGWEMPVQYTTITDEHLAVRNAAGIFDISHMGEVRVTGSSASQFLNRCFTNDIRRLAPGQGQYTLMCNQDGGVVDDLYVYCLAKDDYLLVVNASRTAEDFSWLQSSPESNTATLKNVSDETGAVAVQGPSVVRFIDHVFTGPASGGTSVSSCSGLKKNEIARFNLRDTNVPCWVARTGYTGEDGFEVIADASHIEQVWEKLVSVGKPFGLKPAGLGARDTLRTEVCYPLYGHELDEKTSPLEAGVGFFVALDKGEFTGRAALIEQKASGLTKRLVAFKMTERVAPPRPGYAVWSAGDAPKQVGTVVSGTQSPSLNIGIGLAYVQPEFAKPGTLLQIEARGRRGPAIVVKKPIYTKPNNS